jgi:peptidoglycan glycosyltransferase
MNTRRNIRRLLNVFILLFVLLSGGLVYWQVLVANAVTSNIHNGRRCLSDYAAQRGRIYDRNGILLAYSIPSKTNQCGYQRVYTDPSLANIIGYYIDPILPATGIESQYDSFLNGSVQTNVSGVTSTIDRILHTPPSGDDIYLTIDDRIQKIVAQDFQLPLPVDNVNTFASNKGAVIVSDPQNGQILAMVSQPGFDPNQVASGDITYLNQLQSDPSIPLLNRAINGLYVPGSIYKTVTLMAALDSNNATLNEPFTQKQAVGPVVIGGETFNPAESNILSYTYKYPVSLAYGFTHSDNVMFAQVGYKTGGSTWLNYNQRLFIGQTIPFDLPVSVSSVLPNGQSTLAANQLAEDSFGQGTDFVTPMQMALVDNTVANNGILMKPNIVSAIKDPSGLTLQDSTSQILNTVISPQTAQQVRQAMYDVVRCGSGRYGPPDPVMWTSPWNIIAKTGTGQVAAKGVPAQGWLLTQAPYLNPQLTIVAMKENVGEGASLGGEVTAMYNDIFSQVMKIPLPPAPDPSGYHTYCLSNGLLQ